MKTEKKIIKLILKAEAERAMWSYICKMDVFSGKPKFNGLPLFENEAMKCWDKMKNLAAKNYKKTFEKIPNGSEELIRKLLNEVNK